ncbi:uncharacterized protein A4U43_C03F13990 [Asparagus officinalis]|uniref:Uncharacterized protein n=1 Tax=Asparagus officinalis TaxID=4686 RepID=A0A5P1FEU6_ASPOF|nr:uncharacterized protein A4U43_C03F13990 [Asparagus officinalis]
MVKPWCRSATVDSHGPYSFGNGRVACGACWWRSCKVGRRCRPWSSSRYWHIAVWVWLAWSSGGCATVQIWLSDGCATVPIWSNGVVRCCKLNGRLDKWCSTIVVLARAADGRQWANVE